MFLNHGAVSWKSGLQPMVTLSSCEAEYVALYSSIVEAKYLRQLLTELGYPQPEPTLIWEDNKAAIIVAESEASSASRCKHIDVRFRFAEASKESSARKVCGKCGELRRHHDQDTGARQVRNMSGSLLWREE